MKIGNRAVDAPTDAPSFAETVNSGSGKPAYHWTPPSQDCKLIPLHMDLGDSGHQLFTKLWTFQVMHHENRSSRGGGLPR
ncbi:hypothetical protein D3C86_1533440 [compost metagenome]